MTAKNEGFTKHARQRTFTTKNSNRKPSNADEANKFSFDVAKHITTLDSGIIIIFTSLYSTWITSPTIASNIDVIMIILGLATMAIFFTSTIACVLVMFLIPYQLGEEKIGFWQNWGTDGILVLGIASFIAGILLIIIITFINLVY